LAGVAAAFVTDAPVFGVGFTVGFADAAALGFAVFLSDLGTLGIAEVGDEWIQKKGEVGC